MEYFEKQKIAFFHIPKTAGKSTRVFLQKNFGKEILYNKTDNIHEPLSDKIEVMGEKLFNDTTILTNIRNPYDNVVSYYTWINRWYFKKNYKKNKKMLKAAPWIEEAVGIPFDDFIDWYVKNKKSHEDFLIVGNKIPDNVYIIRFENLYYDINKILNEKLSMKIDVNKMPHFNKTKRKPFIEYYSKETLRKVTDKYQWTFDNFPDYQKLI